MADRPQESTTRFRNVPMGIGHALRQHLESLQGAGVRQLPRVELQPSQNNLLESATKAASPENLQNQGALESQEVESKDLSPSARAEALDRLREEVAACVKCQELAETRTQTVFGIGHPQARLCILGEAPGYDEDRLGEPFVGKAGQLLNRILAACQWDREQVYILNVLKCRPPGNRNPKPEEAKQCRSFLDRQIKLIRPEFICCMGAVAAQNLLATSTPIGRLRGKIHHFQGIQVVCTYHPAYLLRTPEAKAKTWEDMKLLMRKMGQKV